MLLSEIEEPLEGFTAYAPYPDCIKKSSQDDADDELYLHMREREIANPMTEEEWDEFGDGSPYEPYVWIDYGKFEHTNSNGMYTTCSHRGIHLFGFTKDELFKSYWLIKSIDITITITITFDLGTASNPDIHTETLSETETLYIEHSNTGEEPDLLLPYERVCGLEDLKDRVSPPLPLDIEETPWHFITEAGLVSYPIYSEYNRVNLVWGVDEELGYFLNIQPTLITDFDYAEGYRFPVRVTTANFRERYENPTKQDRYETITWEINDGRSQMDENFEGEEREAECWGRFGSLSLASSLESVDSASFEYQINYFDIEPAGGE